jgi:hypothetical protein
MPGKCSTTGLPSQTMCYPFNQYYNIRIFCYFESKYNKCCFASLLETCLISILKEMIFSDGLWITPFFPIFYLLSWFHWNTLTRAHLLTSRAGIKSFEVPWTLFTANNYVSSLSTNSKDVLWWKEEVPNSSDTVLSVAPESPGWKSSSDFC